MMSTETKSEGIVDLEAVLAAVTTGKPIDPVVARRVQKRAEAIRATLPETNVAVELIREARYDE